MPNGGTENVTMKTMKVWLLGHFSDLAMTGGPAGELAERIKSAEETLADQGVYAIENAKRPPQTRAQAT
jgi:hypothetical protein